MSFAGCHFSFHVPHRSVYATYAWTGCWLPAIIRNPSFSPLVSPAQRRDKQAKWVNINLASPGLGWSSLEDKIVRYSLSQEWFNSSGLFHGAEGLCQHLQERLQEKKITALNILGFFASERNARILLGPQRYHRHVPHALAPLSLFFYSACTTQHMGSQFPNQGWDGTHGPCVRSLASHWEPPDKSYLSLSWTSIQQGHISGFSVLVASQYHTELIIFSLTDLKINPT